MLTEADRVRLRHMLDAAQRAIRIAYGRRRADLDDEDDPLVHALIRLITVVGEAAARVTEEGRAVIPGIPWTDVVGVRIV
jgi:uncharacterized protein with HEPN domain